MTGSVPPPSPSILTSANFPLSFSILTIFRNTGSYVSQEVHMALPRIQTKNWIWKAPKSLNLSTYVLKPEPNTLQNMIFGFWTLPFAANMMRNVKRNLTNPVKSNDQMRGGEWSNQGRIVWWRLWQNVWTNFFSRRYKWKFMDRWIQLCAQPDSCNVFLLQYWPLKLNSHFFRGSFHQPTSRGKWVGETD